MEELFEVASMSARASKQRARGAESSGTFTLCGTTPHSKTSMHAASNAPPPVNKPTVVKSTMKRSQNVGVPTQEMSGLGEMTHAADTNDNNSRTVRARFEERQIANAQIRRTRE
ncbi:hypothetical protein [Rhodopirellula bahusiensis]|uniref:hypothetical protein n=1 Tax=Rhodopirellula bahusiensis TaxID=2014065 RepID=UPI0032655C2B